MSERVEDREVLVPLRNRGRAAHARWMRARVEDERLHREAADARTELWEAERQMNTINQEIRATGYPDVGAIRTVIGDEN